MNNALYTAILFYLYITTTVSAVIGINQVGTVSNLLIFIIFLYYFFTHPKINYLAKYKQETLLIVLAIFIMWLRLIRGDSESIKATIFFIVTPAITSILLENQDKIVKKNIFYIILFFFTTECFLAIYEKVFLVNIFPYGIDFSDNINKIKLLNEGFRSTAFLGHPLQNALCISIIMGFILISQLKIPYKISFIFMGYIALLCFNARGAILIWTALIVIFVHQIFLSKQRKIFTHPIVLILFCTSFYIGYDLIINQGFGDRLFNSDELIDGSAQVRLEVSNAFSYMNIDDFLVGSSKNVEILLSTSVVGGYENPYIVLITDNGAFMGCVILITYYFWLDKLLKNYSPLSKLLIIISFIGLGSMNNSLYTPGPWLFFIFCLKSQLSISDRLYMSQKTINSKLLQS